MAPPGSAKSTYCSVIFPAWYMARHPQETLLCCSNTTDLAVEFNRRRRSSVADNRWQLLANSQLDPNRQGAERWGLTTGGSCIAAGVGSSIVGLRSDLSILDDPIQSFEQSMSTTQLEKIWQWYLSDYRSRLKPEAKELMVTTRWARRDPAGRILDLIESGDEEWEVIRLPMLADAEDDPLGRSIGSPLWPEWFGDRPIVENQRDPLRWASMYQQIPLASEGSWVPPDYIQYEDSLPKVLRYVVAVDLALTVGRGDFTVIVVAGICPDGNIHIAEVQRFRAEPDETVERLFSIYKLRKPVAILIDDDPAAKVFMNLLNGLARERKIPLYVRGLRLGGKDKETRAAAIRGWFMQKRVFILRGPPWNEALYRELNEFPYGDHDDQVDALSLIGRELVKLGTPAGPPSKKSHPYGAGVVIENGVPHFASSMEEMFEQRENDKRGFNRHRL